MGPPVSVVEDCRGLLQLLSDGTVVRAAAPPQATVDDGDDDGRVEWRDAVYDAGRGLGVRMYRPPRQLRAQGKQERLLPVLVYFHAGGFCIGSYACPRSHSCCLRFADELPAVVLSFDYRLAPEHRLPAAHEDAAAALLWLHDRLVDGSDAWLANSGADPERLFVSGDSAGGNMTHHLAARFRAAPMRTISGYVLIMPAFDSETPTTQNRSPSAHRIMADRFSRLALPVGANKDNPLLNPLGPDSPSLQDVGRRMLVLVAGDDMFKDNQLRYVEQMKEAGNDVELAVFAGKDHGFFSRSAWSETGTDVVQVIRRFISRDTAC